MRDIYLIEMDGLWMPMVTLCMHDGEVKLRLIEKAYDGLSAYRCNDTLYNYVVEHYERLTSKACSMTQSFEHLKELLRVTNPLYHDELLERINALRVDTLLSIGAIAFNRINDGDGLEHFELIEGVKDAEFIKKRYLDKTGRSQ